MATKIKHVLSAMNEKPIVIYPAYISITGDHAAAAALSQVLYWHGVKGGEFYKTDSELAAEIMVSDKQIRRIKGILKSLPFLNVELRQIPAKTFYDVDYELLADEIEKIELSKLGEGQTSLAQKGQTEYAQKGQTSLAQKGQTEYAQKGQTEYAQKGQTITESTYRDYTEITTDTIAPSQKSLMQNEGSVTVTDSVTSTVTGSVRGNKQTSVISKNKKSTEELLIEFGITGSLARDFVLHRKAKDAPITETVLNGFQREADKAGISIIDAVTISIERGWRGFNAEWDWNPKKKMPDNGGNQRLAGQALQDHNIAAGLSFLEMDI